jgi:peroxiredoxin
VSCGRIERHAAGICACSHVRRRQRVSLDAHAALGKPLRVVQISSRFDTIKTVRVASLRIRGDIDMGRMARNDELPAPVTLGPDGDLDEPLAVGEVAPDFDWIDDNGQHAHLYDLRGEPVLLAFFAAEWDPAREHQLWAYNEVLKRLPAGGTVMGLAQDGRWCEIMLDSEQTMRFPLLGSLGVEGEIARRYGVSGSQAIFVIDERGVACWRHLAADGMLVHLDELSEAMAALLSKQTRPRAMRTACKGSVAGFARCVSTAIEECGRSRDRYHPHPRKIGW